MKTLPFNFKLMILVFVYIGCYTQTAFNENKIQINNIKVSGISETFGKYLISLLPFKQGDSISLEELEKRVKEQNLIYNRRGEIVIEYKLMIIPPVKYKDKRSLLLRVMPRSGLNFSGGNAFGYVGNLNKSGKGDQWGLYLGKNRDGAIYEIPLTCKKYLGFDFQYNKPVDPSLDLKNHDLLNFYQYFRIKINEKWQGKIRIGVWGEADKAFNSMFMKYNRKFGTASLMINPDYVYWVDQIGIGYYGTHEISIGKSINSSNLYIYGVSKNTALVKEHYNLSTMLNIESAYGYRLPEIFPISTPSFYTHEYLSSAGSYNKSVVIDIQERFKYFHHQLIFTHLSYYLLFFNEFSAMGGETLRYYNVFGSGLVFNFSNPVKMDFFFKGALYPYKKGIRIGVSQAF